MVHCNEFIKVSDLCCVALWWINIPKILYVINYLQYDKIRSTVGLYGGNQYNDLSILTEIESPPQLFFLALTAWTLKD